MSTILASVNLDPAGWAVEERVARLLTLMRDQLAYSYRVAVLRNLLLSDPLQERIPAHRFVLIVIHVCHRISSTKLGIPLFPSCSCCCSGFLGIPDLADAFSMHHELARRPQTR